ncbi:MAG TPA: universal stress protein [Acidimicrobiales bacterium]|jgi:nucleotide-binding universal stress UspA family protein|nr:universal stress protein [Acidimicrobiales bacterium]
MTRPKHLPAKGEPGRPRVVVGIDGSPASLAALDAAVAEARWRGAVVQAVLVWRIPDYFYLTPVGPWPAQVAEEETQAAKEALAEALAGVPGDVEAVPEVARGNPAKVLVEAAEGAQLLVVGNRGRGAVAGLVLGSVSHACAAHASCPVLIVRAPADA